MDKQLKEAIEKQIDKLRKIPTYLTEKDIKEAMLQTYELGKQEKTKISLMPVIGQSYWFMSDDGYKIADSWNDVRVDNQKLAVGNVYLIEEDCDKVILKLKAIQTIKIYIAEHFCFEADWTDEEQRKHYIKYSNEGKLWWEFSCTIKYYSPFGYLRSSEDCEELIKNCKEQLDIIFKS